MDRPMAPARQSSTPVARRAAAVWMCAAVGLGLVGCASEPAGPDASGKLAVAVSLLPQAYFVERIGGPHVDVQVLVGPGQHPHTYEPTPKQMARLAGAAVYFRAGVPFEETLCRKLAAAYRNLRIVDTREGLDLMPATEPAHEDEPTEAHRHGGAGETDPHTWLAPKLAKRQARTLCDTLCEVDPAHADAYRRNLAALDADLDRLDAKLAEALAPLRGKTFFVFHPAFGYFAAAYGLRQEAVETGGKSPGPRHVKALIDRARAQGVRVIFVQPQFSSRAARAVAQEIGGAVVPMDPLARDYPRNLEEMAAKIRAALQAKAN